MTGDKQITVAIIGNCQDKIAARTLLEIAREDIIIVPSEEIKSDQTVIIPPPTLKLTNPYKNTELIVKDNVYCEYPDGKESRRNRRKLKRKGKK